MSILSAAADVLRCFSSTRRDLTVTDLVIQLGMPKSNASRLLRAMRDAGLLEPVGQTKRYRPSVLLHQAGQVFRLAASLVDRADAVVGRIAADLGHTGYVSVRQGTDIVAVTTHPGRSALRVVTDVGERIASFASSTGRALLARLPDQEVRLLYADGIVPPTATSPQTMDGLLARLAAVRQCGYAESDDEAVRGVGAISVAVGDPATGDAAALCIAFPAAMASADERATIIRLLGEGAAAIAAVTQDALFIPVKLPAETGT